ncbi:hypothetical protein DAPPUDRAFT_259302 [Daphnia pulex]|uniref:Uncharacterized protein n=1 Tax=Daphnia pulex TaxID=6669 RepID=E9HH11_DAPPU|nr:hypothetical protein DAPPUDRAFT_259302 [Daphnia pulex]|eukprot:EFX68978.1 hypothetical protein DAPPUDRAFT_259302 [Daphnia pulex]
MIPKTVLGYPRILTHLTDSKTFAEWMGGDYVNLDGCYTDPSEMDKSGNPEFGTLLNLTGKPIVPDYQLELVAIKQPIFIGPVSNLWRNFDDINDSWEGVPVDPRPRLVTCYDFTAVEFAPPKSLHLNFLVAKDSICAYLDTLKRTRQGPFETLHGYRYPQKNS